MTTQPSPSPDLTQAPRCLFPHYFYPGSPHRLPQTEPISFPPAPDLPEPEELPTNKYHLYTSTDVVERAIADHISRHGYDIARQDLANWTIEPQLSTTTEGSTVLELFIDPDANPLYSWKRGPDNSLTVSTIEENTDFTDWFHYENPRWKHWYNDEWHLTHNPNALEQFCECWPPWEATSLKPDTPMPRENERYSFCSYTATYLYHASEHLARRIIIKAGQAASDYHENSTIAQAMDRLCHEEPFRRLKLIADTAILNSLTNKSRHNLLSKILHHTWSNSKDYDGRWTPENQAQATSQYPWQNRNDSYEQCEKYSSRLDKLYSLKTPNRQRQDIITATGHANHLLLNRILDPDTTETLNRLHRKFIRARTGQTHGLPQFSTHTIDTTMRNQKAIAQLQETSPHLATLYVTTFSEPDHTFVHPGQIINHIKRHHRLTPAQWKLLCKLAPNIKLITNPSVINADSDIVRIIRILSTANRPEAEIKRLRLLAGASHLHEKHWIKPPRRRKDQHRQAWTKTMNAFLAPGGPDRTTAQLNRVSDAITGTLRAQEPWGQGTWENMLAREARWHHQLRQQKAKKSGKAKWPPLVQEYNDGQFTVSPVTTHKELKHAGDQLNNCLANYYEECTERGTRIYTYHLNGITLVGATELIPTDSGWKLGQTETACDDPGQDREITRAAKRLLKKHQQAADA